MILLFALLLAYVVGSIPTGWLIARALGVKDIKSVGSGNIGATNVARVCGWHWFLVVFLLDGAKAYLTLLVASRYSITFSELLLIAFTILLGNTFSLFLNFRGGKGVATFLGILLFIQPHTAVVLLAWWLLFVLLFRTVGIASVCMVILFPVYCIYNGCPSLLILFSVGVSGLIIWLHRKNMYQYLLHGKRINQ